MAAILKERREHDITLSNYRDHKFTVSIMFSLTVKDIIN